MSRIRLAALTLLTLAAVPSPAPLDAIARDYVQLTLEAGEREPGYVDAYYGPADWAAAAKAKPRTVAELRTAATALKARALSVDAKALSPFEARRRAALVGQLTAAETRLAMNAGVKFSFDDEAERLFGVRPVLPPLASFDPLLADIDALVPGDGPLWQRIDTYRERFVIPPAKVDAVMRAATAECRRRTVAHIPLPATEKFTLELVTAKPWGGYNYYKGNDTSLIQINTDLPIYIDRAVDLGCHEGYPGHHVYNVLLERELSKKRGWTEFTVYPLYSPMSLLAEGSANYGIDLTLPPAERAAFEVRVLYPLAGLEAAEAPRFAALNAAIDRLSGARFVIARDYLDGRIDRATALALTQKYLLLSPVRAEKSLKFTETYRSYVINYGLGRDMVRATVEAAGPDDAARWSAMTRLLSEPTTTADLRR
ncbi:hypothetical protein [Glacieibacterium frigidum]|uniref:DUF885 domain-containing protein n=1 Tax=Glacieibacterium frigidum TaxID=2593303 RepID=A0A552UI53_9SPHN|nr:hypothetical protein [Glacieibacterium frigidum]TRW17871.1 hypothetical protein FMM06_07020 [Glacieibacterium frigidum]